MLATARLSVSSAAPAAPAGIRSFLERLRRHTGMAGVALLGPQAQWLDVAGEAPPTGVSPTLLGTCGMIASQTDPAARFLVTVPVPTIDPEKPRWLVLWDSAPRPEAAAHLLLARLTELVSHAAMERRRAFEIHRQHLIERARRARPHPPRAHRPRRVSASGRAVCPTRNLFGPMVSTTFSNCRAGPR